MGAWWPPEVTSLLPAPGAVRVPSHGVFCECVCCVLTLVFSLSASTPLSYCLARWPLRYFSTCLSWSQCMLDPGACCCGLPFPDVLNENGKKKRLVSTWISSCLFWIGELPLNAGVHATMIRCAVLCCAVWWDWRRPCPPMDLEDVWTRGHNRWAVWLLLVSLGISSNLFWSG